MTTITRRFSHPANVRGRTAIRALLIAAKTVVFTPPHKERTVHDQVAKRLAMQSPQPLNPSVEQEMATIDKILTSSSITISHVSLTAKERLGLLACLMQFSMYDRSLPPFMKTPYSAITRLYDRVVREGGKQPLSLSRQLTIALDETDGDVIEAVWLLFVTSRQYARWYDEESIMDMPVINQSMAITAMERWSKSVMGFKAYNKGVDQDAAGDVYYVWTHTLAKLLFGPMSRPYAVDALLERLAVHNGTWLNHSIAHKVSPQTIKSDHTIAARYGNVIGRLIARHIRQR